MAISVASAGVLFAAPASAVTAASWTVSLTPATIYADGNYARSLFNKPPTSIPSTGVITKTSFSVASYTNGYTTDTVTLCYQQVYTDTDYRCIDIATTGGATVTTPVFNGLSPRGTIVIKHVLTGGNYPTTGTTGQDTVKTDYQY